MAFVILVCHAVSPWLRTFKAREGNLLLLSSTSWLHDSRLVKRRLHLSPAPTGSDLERGAPIPEFGLESS